MDEYPGADMLDDEGVEGMSEEDLRSILSGEIDDAVDYIDNTVSLERAQATDYYWGRPFGNEEDGRSQVVSYDVRDTVAAIMPSLMRVFFAGDNVVEFVPQGPEDEAVAKQATDYINYIVQRDNPGFRVIYAAFKDALVRKSGFIKYWWDTTVKVESWELTGLDEEAIAVLLADPEVSVQELARVEMVDPTIGPLPPEITVRCTRTTTKGRARIMALPPEEFLIDRRATSIEDATLVAHRAVVPVGDLIAMGYDPDVVRDNVGSHELDANQERLARSQDSTFNLGQSHDEAMQPVLYTEAYIRVDYDGDGIPELRKVCTMGASYQIVMNQPAPYRPFVDLCPDPEPHTFFGMSIADVTMDIQRIKSSILRNMLDSLAQSIHPRMAAVEGQVNMDDLLNTEVGGVVRMRQPGMVQQLETTFVGGAAFPVLGYMDEIRENRTGITKAAAGLDPDALQSTTKAAVAATITAAQQRIELIARLFAEGGVTQLFRGLLRLITAHQDRERVIRLNNQWVTIDPRPWNTDMDVVCNVGLGTGDPEARMAFMRDVATRQEGIIQSFGVENNPLVGLTQYRNTLGKMMELAGYKDAGQFFLDPSNAPAVAPKEPPPDPNLIVAQATVEQIRSDMEKKKAELALEREKMLREDDRLRDKDTADEMLKAMELGAKHGFDPSALIASIVNMPACRRSCAPTSTTRPRMVATMAITTYSELQQSVQDWLNRGDLSAVTTSFISNGEARINRRLRTRSMETSGALSLNASGEATDAATWQLDTWGEYLVGCATSDGKLYQWPLTGDAAAITGAPTGCSGLVVTAERILFALGSGGNKRLVKWSDQENNTSWTPSATNQAGSKELATAGAIMAARRVRGQTLILTSVDAHVAEYQGPPYVYGFRSVGTTCGMIAPNAVAVINGDMALWMSAAGSFYIYDGGTVRSLQCDVADFLRRDINFGQQSKIFAFTASDFDEVWWLYPREQLDVLQSSTGQLVKTEAKPQTGLFDVAGKGLAAYGSAVAGGLLKG